jgi:hypothetical protein
MATQLVIERYQLKIYLKGQVGRKYAPYPFDADAAIP